MKTKLSKNWVAGVTATIIVLTGGIGCVSNAQDQPPPPAGAGTATPDNTVALPPGVDANSPLAEVIRLAQSGVSESVILSYVNQSTSPFNLNADQIIYLKDLGVPDDVVTAMIQRDQDLQQQATPPPPAPATTTIVEAAPPPPSEVVTVDYFYGALAPYGTWVYVEGYGRCWRPGVVVYDASWSPYCDHGHWVWTDCGWYWISDYSWGWAPFHYGRWFRDARFGWCWYPDTVWGPSWVTWRYSDNYCGWAPLPPRCVYREGVGFFYNGVSVGINFDFGLNVNCFTFVPTRNFCDPRPWHYRVAPAQVTQVYNNTTIINNFNVDRDHRTFFNHGIDPGRITRVTHRDIQQVTIRDTDNRLPRGEQLGRDGRTLMVNRPHFSDNPARPDRNGSPRGTPPPLVGNPNQPSHNGNDNRKPQPPGNLRPTPTPAPGGPYQPSRNGNDNRNPQSPGHFQPRPAPTPGNPYQPPRNGNDNRNSQPPGHYQPVPNPAPSQPQNPPVNNPGSPNRKPVATPTERPTPPVYHPAPGTPVQPSAPNYNSPDTRRYQSPRMQQGDQQVPRGNAGNGGGRMAAPTAPQTPANPSQWNRYSPPAQSPPQRNYGAPVTPQAPPQVRQPEPPRTYTPPPVQTPPPQSQPERNYNAPRNQAPPANYSQPPSQGNQSRGGNASSSQGQSQSSQGQGNGRGRDQR